MSGSPHQNYIIERKNYTLMTVKWQLSSFFFFWWSEALKTTLYILNKVSLKMVLKTPFELWKPSLRHYLYRIV